jgi:hypothetical protein
MFVGPPVPLPLKRALRTFAILAGWLLFNLGFVHLVASMEDSWWLVPGGVAESIVGTTFLVSNVVIPALLIYWRYKRRGQWIAEEANEWLTKRQNEPSTLRKRNRAILRGLLWLPSLTAMTVFLFLPETMGLVSHLFCGPSVALGKHRMVVPITSFVRIGKLPTGESLYLNVLLGKGICRVGLGPYWQKEPPFSTFFYYANPDTNDHSRDDFLSHDTILSKRTIEFGDETIACWEVANHRREYEPVTRVECRTSKNDLSAGYYGLREDLPEFYNTLSRTTLGE